MKLLTDEHFPAEIAMAVRREMPNCDVQSIHETNLAGLLDQPLLEVLDLQQRTLLTRDVNSIPDFLKERLREGKTHGGVIYVSGGFRQNDLRAVIRALVTFLKRHGDENWGCRESWLQGDPFPIRTADEKVGLAIIIKIAPSRGDGHSRFGHKNTIGDPRKRCLQARSVRAEACCRQKGEGAMNLTSYELFCLCDLTGFLQAGLNS